jgi:hypothetical protein
MVVNRFGCFTPASIHAFNFVANMPIIIFLSQLSRRAVRRAPYLASQLKDGFTPGTLHFVGWVEPTPDFVGFHCTQPNLHFAGDILQRETQQRHIL